ncbi:hypothetical protein KC19_1G249900 [Ceratodon purpureus]|uniref:phospholipid:diacylglycerol acyltransferase n=1 Tax=Ceratodon purpureus TaxID=3225 RepID=A0A8T0J931_CERPU|nr:hypothetical protein KC19_1G249900 [Ceratodon purpureus]
MSTAIRRKGSKQVEDEGTAVSSGHSNKEEKLKDSDSESTKAEKEKQVKKHKKSKKSKVSAWGCIDSCCWLVGYICVTWWILVVLYNALPHSLPQYVTERITGPLPDPPGVTMKKEGLTAKHPVVFVPGIVTGGLELWEGKACADGLFRKRLWGGTFGEIYKRPRCWMEHMSLDNETGLDPEGIRVRPVSGLVAADYFAPGYFVWAVLIENLARIGYEEKSMYMAAYDWRLTFQNTEVRDQSLSRLKNQIESMVQTSGHKAVVIPHSMGSLYFMHFLKWVEAPTPMGGGGGPDWVARHIKANMNIAGPFLGVPKAFAGIFSAEAKDIAVARAIAPGVLDNDIFGLQTIQYIMKVTRTWDSCLSMLPKGGTTIWGNASWSPEEGYDCSTKKSNETDGAVKEQTESGLQIGSHGKPAAHYGRMVAFGKEAAATSYEVIAERKKEVKAPTNTTLRNTTACGDVWTEYQELTWEDVEDIANREIFNADDLAEVLRKVAPKLMARGDENWSFDIADDPSDKKYDHYRYWANPLETTLVSDPLFIPLLMY